MTIQKISYLIFYGYYHTKQTHRHFTLFTVGGKLSLHKVLGNWGGVAAIRTLPCRRAGYYHDGLHPARHWSRPTSETNKQTEKNYYITLLHCLNYLQIENLQ